MRQSTEQIHKEEMRRLQEFQSNEEKRWGAEKKQLIADRDAYSLQCESLKADIAHTRNLSVAAESNRLIGARDEISDLNRKIDDLERVSDGMPSRLLIDELLISRSAWLPESMRGRFAERFSGEPNAADEMHASALASAKTSKVVWK